MRWVNLLFVLLAITCNVAIERAMTGADGCALGNAPRNRHLRPMRLVLRCVYAAPFG